MQNPKARVAIYDAFHQEGKDVKVKFQNGYGEYKYENAELPKDRVQKYSLKGSTGIRILEDAYGLDSVNKADANLKKIMNEITLNANAKINLSLDVLSKRDDEPFAFDYTPFAPPSGTLQPAGQGS